MTTFILRRLLQLPFVILAVTILIVGVLQLLTPQERASAYVTNEQQARNIDRIIKARGLDQPFHIQYGKWLSGTLQGDLGFSKASAKPVWDTLKERFPATLELALFAAIPIVMFGIWLGTMAALHKDKLVDQTVRVLAILGYSLPTFVLGIVLLVVFYGFLGWFPGSGNVGIVQLFEIADPEFKRYTGLLTVDAALNGRWALLLDALHHIVLPALTLIIVISASIVMVMRANLLEALNSDYVRTARAKGLHSRTVHLKHARRNALLPVVTLSGFTFLGLLTGAIFTETIFGYPGIGQWVATAAQQFDIAGVLGFALFSAVLVVIVSTVTDILYGVIDPRVRFD
ncbi:ABC transporter permease [Deinococcus peraridilitoris]|uniref:ABC-type dipeptide/oligopeptide/nickel transport system, permease component n=1 Tax=Deinococcus peraridilitoris (strain DSM 19664 / LMG 22246 / CIP 109416 / KR-200) TaxID=937777 RepID=K9ZYA2_DEIPD|nr:ABC transporter permease [Deinococcus peraridilitoris]AFZ66576.1 ABC-type dipeptide/oligopeptide/nickel transport system, permease component [Deinococcus peraridilitoris DSM 19664]